MAEQVEHRLIPAADIPEMLTHDIAQAETRVHLQAMEFLASGAMKEVCDELIAATERGVDVSIWYDKFSYINHSVADVKELWQFRQKAIKVGAKVLQLGASLLPNPLAGRSHTKLSVIDNTSYFGGGVNLVDTGFASHDFMLRQRGYDKMANSLLGLVKQQKDNAEDFEISVDEATTLLADGGTTNQSLILDRATTMVEGAEEIWYVSQLSPSRNLEDAFSHLPSNARKIWFNTPISSRWGKEKSVAWLDNQVSRSNNLHQGSARLRAKFVVALNPDGTYEAITGSHNLSDWGVRLGTKEASLHTKDQALCAELVRFAEAL